MYVYILDYTIVCMIISSNRSTCISINQGYSSANSIESVELRNNSTSIPVDANRIVLVVFLRF